MEMPVLLWACLADGCWGWEFCSHTKGRTKGGGPETKTLQECLSLCNNRMVGWHATLIYGP